MNWFNRIASVLIISVLLTAPTAAFGKTCGQFLEEYAQDGRRLPRLDGVRVTQESVNNLYVKWGKRFHKEHNVPYLQVEDCTKSYVDKSLLNEERELRAAQRDPRFFGAELDAPGEPDENGEPAPRFVVVRPYDEAQLEREAWYEKLRPVFARFAKPDELLLLDYRVKGLPYEEIVEVLRARGHDVTAEGLRQKLSRFKKKLVAAGLNDSAHALGTRLEETAMKLAQHEAAIRVAKYLSPQLRTGFLRAFEPFPGRPSYGSFSTRADSIAKAILTGPATDAAILSIQRTGRTPRFQRDEVLLSQAIEDAQSSVPDPQGVTGASLEEWHAKAEEHSRLLMAARQALNSVRGADAEEDVAVLRKVLTRRLDETRRGMASANVDLLFQARFREAALQVQSVDGLHQRELFERSRFERASEIRLRETAREPRALLRAR